MAAIFLLKSNVTFSGNILSTCLRDPIFESRTNGTDIMTEVLVIFLSPSIQMSGNRLILGQHKLLSSSLFSCHPSLCSLSVVNYNISKLTAKSSRCLITYHAIKTYGKAFLSGELHVSDLGTHWIGNRLGLRRSWRSEEEISFFRDGSQTEVNRPSIQQPVATPTKLSRLQINNK